MPIKSANEWAEDYWSRDQAGKAFIHFIKEVQSDTILGCADTIEEISDGFEPARVLRGMAGSLIKPKPAEAAQCDDSNHYGGNPEPVKVQIG